MATTKEVRRYRVIRDTREQQGNGWMFPTSPTCDGTTVGTLKTGDYTIEGYESVLCVERKRNTAEISMNIFEKRFPKVLERMNDFKWAYVICEFTMADIVSFPFMSGIPQKRWSQLRVSPQLLMKKIIEFQLTYSAKWIFAGTNGREFCSSLFKRVIENEEKDKNYFRA